MKVVLASSNQGKLRELVSLLAPMGFELVAQNDLGLSTPPETGATFVANALLKARYVASATALPALADDSGIEVDALEGRPGVYSARYAGENATDLDNLSKLLQELRGVPTERRTARYRCVLAFVRSAADPAPIVAEGTWEGSILFEPRGTGGFGYDPIFLPTSVSRTAAELSPQEKSAVSHRGVALRDLMTQLTHQQLTRQRV